MAVTIDVGQLLEDLYLTQNLAAVLRLGRMLPAATAIVEEYAPGAPEAVQNRAVSMLCGFWYSQDPAPEYRAQGNSFAFSGAQALLTRWKVRRAGAIG